VQGVWSNWQTVLSQTAFFSWLNGLNVSLSAGTCCSYDIDTTFYGVMTLTLPSSAILGMHALVLIFAIFVARRLIFGG
jgi:hypothetical protein